MPEYWDKISKFSKKDVEIGFINYKISTGIYYSKISKKS